MCLWLLYAQAFHEPAVLLRCDLLRLFAGPGPLEAPAFQALVQEQESVPLPQQSLDAILSPATEQKQRFGKRIQFILPLHDSGQAVDPAAEIRIAQGYIDSAGLFTQHGTSPPESPLPRLYPHRNTSQLQTLLSELGQ